MSDCPFCKIDRAGDLAALNAGEGKRARGFWRRAWRGVQWVFPTMVVVLMPKCPLCVAAYVALFTGVTISVAAAEWVQRAAWGICFVSLAYLAVRFVFYFRRRSYVDRTGHVG